mmetsp:Transcript_22999/g.55764  ORF Transcript_22999/g.55764 Transcript_22999/m.55764 type:complete len:353 (-) Transcript_22999:1172-2230(-)
MGEIVEGLLHLPQSGVERCRARQGRSGDDWGAFVRCNVRPAEHQSKRRPRILGSFLQAAAPPMNGVPVPGHERPRGVRGQRPNPSIWSQMCIADDALLLHLPVGIVLPRYDVHAPVRGGDVIERKPHREHLRIPLVVQRLRESVVPVRQAEIVPHILGLHVVQTERGERRLQAARAEDRLSHVPQAHQHIPSHVKAENRHRRPPRGLNTLHGIDQRPQLLLFQHGVVADNIAALLQRFLQPLGKALGNPHACAGAVGDSQAPSQLRPILGLQPRRLHNSLRACTALIIRPKTSPHIVGFRHLCALSRWAPIRLDHAVALRPLQVGDAVHVSGGGQLERQLPRQLGRLPPRRY